MNTFLKRVAVGISMLGGLTIGYAWGAERRQMHVRQYPIRLRKGAGAGLRILHLSDQHFGGDDWIRRSRLKKLGAMLPSLRPDLIALTGDFLHNDSGLAAVEALLQLLPPAPLGCYAVLGNHDYAEYSYKNFFQQGFRAIKAEQNPRLQLSTAARELRAFAGLFWQIYRNDRIRFAAVPNNTAELRALLELYKIEVLDNEAIALPGMPDLWLAGVDDLVEGQPDLAGTIDAVPATASLILLTHHPDLAYDPASAGVDLVLSGHTHGGQVVLPGLGAIHTQGTRLSRRHPAGYFDDLANGGQMIVSRGMGESTPLRLRCPPEIVLIDLIP